MLLMNYFKRKLKRLPVYEWAEFGFFLCFVGGFLDAYTFLTRGGVFANAQTGNLILLVIGLARGDGFSALRYLFPVLVFCLGVFSSQLLLLLGKKRGNDFGGHGVILIAEIALLCAVGFIPASAPDTLVNAVISFVAAIQYDNFRRMEGMAIATAFCTGNLRAATEQLFRSFADKTAKPFLNALRYFLIIFGFMAGVCGGYFAAEAFWEKSAFFVAAILSVPLFALVFSQRPRKKLLRTAYAVRTLTKEEIPAAKELIFETFTRFIAPDYTEEGKETYRKFLFESGLEKEAEFYGVFDGNALQGALAVSGTHIRAFFVRCGQQGKGYGGALMRAILNKISAGEITVNASRYGKPVYEKFGFAATDEEQQKDGIIYTPMKLTRT